MGTKAEIWRRWQSAEYSRRGQTGRPVLVRTRRGSTRHGRNTKSRGDFFPVLGSHWRFWVVPCPCGKGISRAGFAARSRDGISKGATSRSRHSKCALLLGTDSNASEYLEPQCGSLFSPAREVASQSAPL